MFVNQACEETVIDYLIACLDPMELTASYYGGYGNVEDLQSPAVVVAMNEGTEVFYNSNVYELFGSIQVKEMAADISASNVQGGLGVLSHNIQNCLWAPNIETALNLTGSHNFVTYQLSGRTSRYSYSQDALISELDVRIVGTLSGSIP